MATSKFSPLTAEELEVIPKRDDLRISYRKEMNPPDWAAVGHVWIVMSTGVAARKLTEAYGNKWGCVYEADPVDSSKTLCLLTVNGVTRAAGSPYGTNAALNQAAKLWGIGTELDTLPVEGVPFRGNLWHVWANKGRLELFHKLRVTRYEVTDGIVTWLDVMDTESNDKEPVVAYRNPHGSASSPASKEAKGKEPEAPTTPPPQAESKDVPAAPAVKWWEHKPDSPVEIIPETLGMVMKVNLNPAATKDDINEVLSLLPGKDALWSIPPVVTEGGELKQITTTFGMLSAGQIVTLAHSSPSPMTTEILKRLQESA